MPSIRRPGDDSEPLPERLQPRRGLLPNTRAKKRRAVRGTGPYICFVCKGNPDAKPPEPPRHLHDFQFRTKNGCQCRHPGHGLPRKKRT